MTQCENKASSYLGFSPAPHELGAPTGTAFAIQVRAEGYLEGLLSSHLASFCNENQVPLRGSKATREIHASQARRLSTMSEIHDTVVCYCNVLSYTIII